MLDLETFGTGRDAAIASIGVQQFDLMGGTLGKIFYKVVNLATSTWPGTFDASTIYWWLEQRAGAQGALLVGERVALDDVLAELRLWLTVDCGAPTNDSTLRLWSNGPLFDEMILRDAHVRYRMPFPWHYKSSRCCRTYYSMLKEFGLSQPPRSVGLAHCAIDDAKNQAEHMIWIAKELREVRQKAMF